MEEELAVQWPQGIGRGVGARSSMDLTVQPSFPRPWPTPRVPAKPAGALEKQEERSWGWEGSPFAYEEGNIHTCT